MAAPHRHLGACQSIRGVALAVAQRTVRVQRVAPLTVCKVITTRKQADAPEAEAHLRFQRGSTHKVRRVLDAIRGRTYEDALMILEYSPYRACEPIQKTLLSAAANAKNNQGMSKTKLFVSECFSDEGPVLKRFQPRAKGRPFRILKPMCHITIKVQERAA
ncbi:hypothetical protein WJX72_007798 [[Myrmecia] bisecta]|uniref:Large ribosomal subunit protein uL22c n=1 Tax=[Myrmecia] bisecta TaxID=41462 RepID=A0AAW1NYR4_9CHLO